MRFIKWILLLFSVVFALFGCNQNISEGNNTFALQPGDLLFHDIDCGPLCDAIERVTIGYKGANFSHIGIVTKNDSGGFSVIEAVSKGVVITPLRTFLGRSFDTRHQPKVVVGRVKESYRHLIPSALKEGLALKGKPYDKKFAIDNEAYYCSELIYEIFLRANDNEPVFKLQPMTFKNPDTGEILSAWKEYFSELGISIPEGQPGINPGGISRSPVLAIVYAYGNQSRNRAGRR